MAIEFIGGLLTVGGWLWRLLPYLMMAAVAFSPVAHNWAVGGIDLMLARLDTVHLGGTVTAGTALSFANSFLPIAESISLGIFLMEWFAILAARKAVKSMILAAFRTPVPVSGR
jgi:hypothetical protein